MADLSHIPADARLYLRPVDFVDSPIGLDGETARIGNSLIWYRAIELSAMKGGARVARATVRIAEWEAVQASFAAPLRERAAALFARIGVARPPVKLGERVLRFDAPLVMGILNMTPDSFSDGGKHMADPSAAADAGFAMHAAGAAIIDVGGESTRPGADTVWEGDEIKRVVPVIERLARAGVPVSIDTRKASVMEAALAAGAHMINDVTALLHDPRSMEVAAKADCPIALMHVPSTGDDLHINPGGHADPAGEVFDWLEQRIAACEAAGIARERLIADPGLGFGKAMADNLAIINRLPMFQALGVPLLVGASRKRMIGALSNEAPADKRLGGSVALAFRAAELGAQIVRVHDVPETVQALHVWRGLRDAALVAG